MIRFLNLTGEWINLKKKVPIYVAASGPKTLELAGEIGDGVILFGAVGESLLEYTLSHIRRGAERVGKRLQDLYICVLTAFHVAEPGEELAEMQRAVGAYVASECNIFALSVKDPNDLPADSAAWWRVRIKLELLVAAPGANKHRVERGLVGLNYDWNF